MPNLNLQKSIDIIKKISKTKKTRPRLIIGFAAETRNLIINSKKKLREKGSDWILANKITKQNRNLFSGRPRIC